MSENKYSNGKIYKVVNDVNTIVYIGSTTQKYLSSRMTMHREHAKAGTSVFHTAMRELGIKSFKIQLIKLFPCTNIEELLAEEYRIMKKYKKKEVELYNTLINRGSISKIRDSWAFRWWKNNKRMCKAFSITKYGNREARMMAESVRDEIYPE